jgi:hypothetical protein
VKPGNEAQVPAASPVFQSLSVPLTTTNADFTFTGSYVVQQSDPAGTWQIGLCDETTGEAGSVNNNGSIGWVQVTH